MNNSFFISLLAGTLAGAAAALATTLVIESKAPLRVMPAGEQRAPLPVPDGAFQRELAALRAENEDLALRVAVLESRPAQAPATRKPLSSEKTPESAVPDIERAASLLAAPSAPLSSEFRQHVEEAVQSIREEETLERELSRATAREERREKRLAELTDKLILDDYQVGEMRAVLTTQDERRGELFETLRETGDRRALREGMREIEDDAQATLARVLTPDQLEGLREYREEQRFGGGLFGGTRRGAPDDTRSGATNRGR